MKKTIIGLMLLLLAQGLSWPQSLTWKAGTGYRYAELNVSSNGTTGFTLVNPGLSKISYTNFIPEVRGITNRVLLSGSGLALGDIDGDGLCDISAATISPTQSHEAWPLVPRSCVEYCSKLCLQHKLAVLRR